MLIKNEILKMRKSFNREIMQEFAVEITTRESRNSKKVDVIVAANDDKYVITYHKSPSCRSAAKQLKKDQERIREKLKKIA